MSPRKKAAPLEIDDSLPPLNTTEELDEDTNPETRQLTVPETVPEAVQVKSKPKEVDVVAETKADLATKPQINFIIPLSDGEKPGAFDTVQINGYKMIIQKGVMVTIPLPCAELLAAKYRINLEAGAKSRIDRNVDVQDALN